MADLTQLLYGANLTVDSISIGQVIDASGTFLTRAAPQFSDCDNAVDQFLIGRYGYGELNVRTVLGSGTGSDVSQLLYGSTFTFNSKLVGQVISIGGTLLTRQTHEFSDCDNDKVTIKPGTLAYGALNVSAVYDPTASTGSFANYATKAINATPTGQAVLTLGGGMTLTAATACITNLDLPGAGGASDRLTISLTVQPVSGSAWEVSGTGNYGTLVSSCIDSDPVVEAEFVYGDGSKISTTAAVVTRLDLPTAGSDSDRVTQSLSLRPVNDGVWSFTGKA